MKKSIFIFTVVLLTINCTFCQLVRPPDKKSEIIVYPASEGSPVSNDYKCMVNGRDVAVYTAGVERRGKSNQDHPYYFCYFDLSGEATITVSSKVFSLDNAILVPNHEKVKYKTDSDGSLVFTVKGPTKITVMPKGYDELLRVLHIFVNPIEPVPQGPNVKILSGCPPVQDRIFVEAGQTLYIAGGAFIRTNMTVRGAGAQVIGRGIIDFSTWPHFEGPEGGPFRVIGEDPKNPILIDGVILRQGWRATMSTGGRGLKINNVKIVSSSVVNDDPIWNNASDVTIREMFIRGDDDCIGIKGNGGDVRNVSVRNCQLWSDRARNVIFGPESQGDVYDNIEFANIDMYRHISAADSSGSKCLKCYAIAIHSGARSFTEPQKITNVLFEDIRIHSEKYNGELNLFDIRTVVQERWGVSAPGIVDGPVLFRNITYNGDPNAKIMITGYDTSHPVKNITFSGLYRNGQLVTGESPGITIGQNTGNIRFIK